MPQIDKWNSWVMHFFFSFEVRIKDITISNLIWESNYREMNGFPIISAALGGTQDWPQNLKWNSSSKV